MLENIKMSEFNQGIFNAIKTLIKGSSLTLAIIYTLGHIVIAMAVVSIMTGAVYGKQVQLH